MNKQIIVTAAIIENEGKFLITQRLKNKHNGLRWEFPGGTLEFGEDPKKCLQREIFEELGIKIEVLNFFEYSSFVYEDKKHIILLGFHCKFISGNIVKKEIEDYAWVLPSKMKDYDITQADIPFVEKLCK
jgi:8-oxo-dGTP diphosphatase